MVEAIFYVMPYIVLCIIRKTVMMKAHIYW